MQVTVNPHQLIVMRPGELRHVQFTGTRQACDEGRRRTTRQVAIRWAELTGSSEELASAAWRKLAPGPFPWPSMVPQDTWVELLTGLDSEISIMVNDPNSRFYIYG